MSYIFVNYFTEKIDFVWGEFIAIVSDYQFLCPRTIINRVFFRSLKTLLVSEISTRLDLPLFCRILCTLNLEVLFKPFSHALKEDGGQHERYANGTWTWGRGLTKNVTLHISCTSTTLEVHFFSFIEAFGFFLLTLKLKKNLIKNRNWALNRADFPILQ